MSIDSRIFDARVRIVTGKGGTGKSTVALALAMVAQQAGKRVLLCETNPSESLARFLGEAPLTGEPRRLADNLWGVALIPDDAIREYALMTLKFKALYNAVFENRIVRYFLRAVPSLGEFVMLGKLWFHEQEDRYDIIIVDAPATGHFISWLRVPHVFTEMMPAGPLKKSAGDMLQMLQQRTKVDIVTLAEEMPVNEAVEIDHAVEHMRLAQRGLIVVNKLFEPVPPELIPALTGKPGLEALLDTITTREHWRTLGERYLLRLPADDLASAIRLMRREPPLLGAAVFSAIAREIEAQL